MRFVVRCELYGISYRCVLFGVCWLLDVVGCIASRVRCLLFVDCWLLFVLACSCLFVVCCLLFVVVHWLPVFFWLLLVVFGVCCNVMDVVICRSYCNADCFVLFVVPCFLCVACGMLSAMY